MLLYLKNFLDTFAQTKNNFCVFKEHYFDKNSHFAKVKLPTFMQFKQEIHIGVGYYLNS